jgi:hypothetical protein
MATRQSGRRSSSKDGSSAVNATIERIRDLNERIVEYARGGGEASLEAYERMLKRLAEAQERAGARGADWLGTFAKAQAEFTRELADAYPSAARAVQNYFQEFTSTIGEQAKRVPGVATAEGEAKGTVAREQDLPIANYDDLSAAEINKRLKRLSKEDLSKVDAYERRHKNRKSVLERIESARSNK